MLLAVVGGVLAAGATLLVCLAIGVVGWFLTDAGAHGAPRDGMRTGALAWLMAHGGGVSVQGTAVTVVPLGLTLVCAWATWRIGYRVGAAASGHGPDADRISDGERDLTVPTAVGVFGISYAVVATVVWSLASGEAGPRLGGVLTWVLLLTVAVALPAIATGSGRAAIWAALAPSVVRHGAVTALAVLVAFLAVSAVGFLAAFVLDLGDAASMMSRLHTSPGEAALYAGVNAGFAPNAVAFAGSYLLGPGFAVGAGTLVSPGLAVIGALPMLPLTAALPDTGETSSWVAALVAVPPVTAMLATAWTQRRRPTLRWDEGALRGCGGGIVAGLLFALVASVSGGAAGPGRMAHLGPFVLDVLVHAVTAFGVGGLVGGLLMTWWQRRRSDPVDLPV